LAFSGLQLAATAPCYTGMQEILSVFVGVGLAAACGFRVFIPLLVVSVAGLSGQLTLSPSFQWIASYPALITFGVATALEVTAYYVPWLDNLLDSIATPAAVVAGTVVSASMISGMNPYLQWTLAAIAGGGAAAAVQSATVVTRAASTAATGGLANPVVATAELGLSLLTSFLTLVLPVLTVLTLLVVGIFVGRKLWRRFAQRKASQFQQTTATSSQPVEYHSVHSAMPLVER
jgi:hypothetical protein